MPTSTGTLELENERFWSLMCIEQVLCTIYLLWIALESLTLLGLEGWCIGGQHLLASILIGLYIFSLGYFIYNVSGCYFVYIV